MLYKKHCLLNPLHVTIFLIFVSIVQVTPKRCLDHIKGMYIFLTGVYMGNREGCAKQIKQKK